MTDFPIACPVPHGAGDRVLLAHGEGGRLMRRLIRELVLKELDNDWLRPLGDGAVLPAPPDRCVLTTDSHVVSPLFFPGGDIGRLAVHGTVNDLASCGAEPVALTLGLIIEEGFPLDDLGRVLKGVAAACAENGVAVATGDTKVVPRGAADGLFLHSTGLGRLVPGIALGHGRIRPGDRILISGTVADHGIAVLAAREEFDLGPALRSDCASVLALLRALAESPPIDVRFLRDPTRGGVAAVLHELVESTGLAFVVEENAVPVAPPVRAACELLGLDPLHVANEGKLVAVMPEHQAEAALARWRSHPLGRNAACIGRVLEEPPGQVLVQGFLGHLRFLEEPRGAPLPRIC